MASYNLKVKKEEFRKEINTFLSDYTKRIEDLAFKADYEATGKVIDLTGKIKEKVTKRAKDLISDFDIIHAQEMSSFLTLVKKYNDIQTIEQKKIIKEEIQKYKSQLRRLLRILNVKAEVLLEEIEEHSLAITESNKLKKLKVMQVEEVENYWLAGIVRSPLD